MEKIKILVVDDERRVREEIAEFLANNKFEVYKAAAPSEAFKILDTKSVDIMILDIRLLKWMASRC
jgi:DNA-binding response OmpR family regulator